MAGLAVNAALRTSQDLYTHYYVRLDDRPCNPLQQF